ncbi:hypothetical protein C8Q77DRAFT_1062309 [Trametes polyzona]|nr:hypothetical protein C8Q77DRAFT_1062309 [Trametes polyzona]
MLSNDIAALIGFACESALWGGYCVLFLISLNLFYKRNQKGELNVFVVFVHCLLFGACTAHYALEFNHFYTTLQAIGVHGFANETKPLVGADILIPLTDLLGDTILLYRCWAMWGGNLWILVLPVLTSLAGFGCLMQAMHYVVTRTPTSPVPADVIVPLTTAGYALPLGTNVMASGLLVLKIWLLTRAPGVSPAYTLRRTVRLAMGVSAIVIESGLLYLATQLVLVVLITIKHPAEAVVGVMAVQIYGIASTLIVIRVALGISAENTTFGPETGHGGVSQLVYAKSGRTDAGTGFTEAASRAGAGGSTTRVPEPELDSFELKFEGVGVSEAAVAVDGMVVAV